jgi:hypothetical protein
VLEAAERGNHGDTPADQFRRKGRDVSVLVSRAQFDRDVVAFDKATFAQTFAESGHPLGP